MAAHGLQVQILSQKECGEHRLRLRSLQSVQIETELLPKISMTALDLHQNFLQQDSLVFRFLCLSLLLAQPQVRPVGKQIGQPQEEALEVDNQQLTLSAGELARYQGFEFPQGFLTELFLSLIHI